MRILEALTIALLTLLSVSAASLLAPPPPACSLPTTHARALAWLDSRGLLKKAVYSGNTELLEEMLTNILGPNFMLEIYDADGRLLVRLGRPPRGACACYMYVLTGFQGRFEPRLLVLWVSADEG